MIVSEIFVVKRLGDHAHKLLGHVVSKEIAEVHDRGVILARKPRFLFALALSSNVPLIASWNLCTCTKVRPKSVF